MFLNFFKLHSFTLSGCFPIGVCFFKNNYYLFDQINMKVKGDFLEVYLFDQIKLHTLLVVKIFVHKYKFVEKCLLQNV